MPRKGRSGRKADSVPRELVRRHVVEFCDKFPDKPKDDDGFMTPYEILAERSGLNYSYFWKMHRGKMEGDVRFDVADRIFCAMGSPNLWHSDPGLKNVYERVVVEADRLRPLELAA